MRIWILMLVQIFCLPAGLSAKAGAELRGSIIADATTEYSCVQGQDNWYYGYYDGNVRLPYTAADFEFLPNCSTHEWLLRTEPGGFWTGVGAEHMHPNGEITYMAPPAEHWAVKRWISEVAGEITILGTLADIEGGYGDGIVGHIFADDVEIWSQRINDGDSTGVEYMVSATVDIGSVIDFAVSPGPHSNDYRDLTRFTMTITPEPGTLLVLGLGGVRLLRRREVGWHSHGKG